MKLNTIPAAALMALACLFPGAASAAGDEAQEMRATTDEDMLLGLSRQKWLWMADRQLDQLAPLFHNQARFVHMSRTMNRDEELEVIRSGGIHYKYAEIRDMAVETIGDVAIVYSRIRLTAVVGGNEVVNPFSVTETYIRQEGRWVLAGMAFSRLVGE